MALALAKMVAYLVDWSLTDVDEQPIIIREQPAAFVSDALDNLPVDDWVELLNAVTAHERTMERDRDDEKKTGTGNSKSEATSPLPESLVGATNGSPN